MEKGGGGFSLPGRSSGNLHPSALWKWRRWSRWCSGRSRSHCFLRTEPAPSICRHGGRPWDSWTHQRKHHDMFPNCTHSSGARGAVNTTTKDTNEGINNGWRRKASVLSFFFKLGYLSQQRPCLLWSGGDATAESESLNSITQQAEEMTTVTDDSTRFQTSGKFSWKFLKDSTDKKCIWPELLSSVDCCDAHHDRCRNQDSV